MPELLKSRAIFPAGRQKAFLEKAQRTLLMSTGSLASFLRLSSRTITDWKREKFSMSFAALKKITKAINQSIPSIVDIKKPYWYTHHAGRAGGQALYKKYGIVGGNPKHRIRQWRKWWRKEGQFKTRPAFMQAKPIRKPHRSKALAEFVGIMLGDGGMSQRQLTITLHHVDDQEYLQFVKGLIRHLFHVPISIYHDWEDSVNRLTVSRTELIKFCTKIGLVVGNKIAKQVHIPSWILHNPQYRVACVRGLIDTDGSIFQHRYQVKGKWYSYTKMGFTSRSRPLLFSVQRILKNLKIRSIITGKYNVRIDAQQDLHLYFATVGSHNPKHLKKYRRSRIVV